MLGNLIKKNGLKINMEAINNSRKEIRKEVIDEFEELPKKLKGRAFDEVFYMNYVQQKNNFNSPSKQSIDLEQHKQSIGAYDFELNNRGTALERAYYGNIAFQHMKEAENSKREFLDEKISRAEVIIGSTLKGKSNEEIKINLDAHKLELMKSFDKLDSGKIDDYLIISELSERVDMSLKYDSMSKEELKNELDNARADVDYYLKSDGSIDREINEFAELRKLDPLSYRDEMTKFNKYEAVSNALNEKSSLDIDIVNIESLDKIKAKQKNEVELERE